MNGQKRDFKLGLALAGGGVRGFAQIPLLGVLQENGIVPDYLAGTSIGSIMASFYAIGASSQQIADICLKTAHELVDSKAFTRPNPMFLAPTKNKLNGLVNGEIIEDTIKTVLESYGVKNILDVEIPIVIVSVDTVTKKVVYFTNDWDFKPSRDAIVINDIPLASAIRSSCSYPGIIAANPVGDMLLSDGGLRMNLPVEPLYDMGADKVMSVSMTKDENVKSTHSAIKTAMRCVDILFDELMELQIGKSDFNVDLKVGSIPAFDFTRADEVYERGLEYAKEYESSVIDFCMPQLNSQTESGQSAQLPKQENFFRRIFSTLFHRKSGKDDHSESTTPAL